MNRRVFLLLIGVCLLASTAQAQSNPDLSGTWLINDQLSEDPANAFRAAARKQGSGGMLRGIARSVSVFGIPVGSLPLPQGGGNSQDADDGSYAAYTSERVAQIRLLQDPDATEIEYDKLGLVSYRHGIVANAEGAIVTADWTRRGFRVEHELTDGTMITETYSLDAPKQQLHWAVSIKRKKSKTIEFTRIYDRSESAGLQFAT